MTLDEAEQVLLLILLFRLRLFILLNGSDAWFRTIIHYLHPSDALVQLLVGWIGLPCFRILRQEVFRFLNAGDAQQAE